MARLLVPHEVELNISETADLLEFLYKPSAGYIENSLKKRKHSVRGIYVHKNTCSFQRSGENKQSHLG